MNLIKLKKNQILEKSNGYIKTFVYVKKVHRKDIYTLFDYFTRRFVGKYPVEAIMMNYKISSNKFKIKTRR